jgi:hypothetical protein
MDYFWTNTIWYIILGVSTLLTLIYVLVKAKNRPLAFAFFLTVAGLFFCIEVGILIFLEAYTYYPKILEHPPYQFDEDIAGNLFSQSSIAATTLLVAVFNFNYYWYLIIAIIYGLIEEAFLYLGIYSHNWYRTWMTVAACPIFLWLGKKAYQKITGNINPMLYYGYIILGLFPLNVAALTWALMLLRLQEFSTLVLADPMKSRHFLVLIHFLLLAIPLLFVYFNKVKLTWKVIVILGLYAIYYIGYKLDLILIREGSFLPVATISIFVMYMSIYIQDRMYKGN